MSETGVLHTNQQEIRTISNWHEWLAHWEKAETFQWKNSLLHDGFTISLERAQYGEKEYDEIDRIAFYFDIADGWADEYLHKLPTDGTKEYFLGYDENWHKIVKNPSQLRQLLALKAFDVLCLNFFKMKLGEGGRRGEQFNHEWASQIVSERLFPIIQNFFRIEKGQNNDEMRTRNLARLLKQSHNERQAVAFLLNLAKFLWVWEAPDTTYWGPLKDEEDKRFAEMRVRVDTAKVWMTEVLVNLDKLDVLREWILELDKACLAKLKEIAMRSMFELGLHPVTEDRPVATLDEACYAGSMAAWFLKEHWLRTREHQRLTAIRDAEERRAELDRKIDELTAE